jgi:DNA-binding transcriptional regulator YiaG
MEELVDTMEAGGMEAVRNKFTVRKVRVTKFAVPDLDKTDVVAIRNSLGVSQPVFAALVGVSPSLVKAWEQGSKAPSGVALRFLAEIRRNPKYWMQRVREAAVAV